MEQRARSRPGGVRKRGSTGWTAQGKPIWFTEFGCPAVDKGPNQPNVFFDPKSSESTLPYFSRGSKDDPIQRAYLEVWCYWRDHAPTSSVYGGPMLSTANMFAWAWDARPFPDFPAAPRSGTNAKLRARPLAHRTRRRGAAQMDHRRACAAVGVTAYDTAALLWRLDAGARLRDRCARQPARHPGRLMDAFQFDARESGGIVQFFAKGNVRMTALTDADLVVTATPTPATASPGPPTPICPAPCGSASRIPSAAMPRPVSRPARRSATARTWRRFRPPRRSTDRPGADVAATVLQQTWAARDTGSI